MSDLVSPIIPETASFTPAQRDWLNGFFVALCETGKIPVDVLVEAASTLARKNFGDAQLWHKPGLPLEERMSLAEGRTLPDKLMAAMAQQDCGRCGYDCASYAGAVASADESRLDLCEPGGKDTVRMLKALLTEQAGGGPAFDGEAYRRRIMPVAEPDKGPGYHPDESVHVSVKRRHQLTKPGSEKDVYHIEIDLGNTGLQYVPGDAFGVYPENNPVLADAVMTVLGFQADVQVRGRDLRDILIEDVSLGMVPDALFELVAALTGGEHRQKAKQLAKGEDPDGDAATLDVLAALQKFPGINPSPEAFVDSLDPLRPRLYSIASSSGVEAGQLALTVDRVSYEIDGRVRHGVASSWLTERVPAGRLFRGYVKRAHHFRLPEDGNTPIIMVGPGTGIAPFRGFLQERAAAGAAGESWLFFGHRRAETDFLYQEELEMFRARKVLSRLSLAWSREGNSKRYVQHLMVELGEELWDWLYRGACFYVCGDAENMAGEVEDALVEIVTDYGNRDEDAARDYIEKMKKTGRYQRDVY
jgi:sulfite reductase (NADPH) flavoprotein alpha-component